MPCRPHRHDDGPGRAPGERLCRQRGRLTPRTPALRPSHSRTRHHPTTDRQPSSPAEAQGTLAQRPKSLLTNKEDSIGADVPIGTRTGCSRSRAGLAGLSAVRGARRPSAAVGTQASAPRSTSPSLRMVTVSRCPARPPLNPRFPPPPRRGNRCRSDDSTSPSERPQLRVRASHGVAVRSCGGLEPLSFEVCPSR